MFCTPAWHSRVHLCLALAHPNIASLHTVTPTLLAGDRSLVSVVAHEIAHSWTGNLITNATWEDFWLNEGDVPAVAANCCNLLVPYHTCRAFSAFMYFFVQLAQVSRYLTPRTGMPGADLSLWTCQGCCIRSGAGSMPGNADLQGLHCRQVHAVTSELGYRT